MPAPKCTISVVIPAFNCAKYIQQALNSVISQTFPPHEIIVVNDGSTDDTEKQILQFGDKVSYVYQENGGPSKARNIGIQKATGKYIAFLDADDEWTPQHLENAAAVLTRFSDLEWFACAWQRKSRQDKIARTSRFRGTLKQGAIIEDYFRAETLSENNLIHTNVVVVRRGLILNIGGFKVDMHRGEDRLMWFKLGMKEPKLGYSPDVGAIYYSTEDSLTGQDNLKDAYGFIKEVVDVIKENRPNYAPHSNVGFLNKLICEEIHYLHNKKDRDSLLKLQDVCKGLMFRRNAFLIQLGLLFPKAMRIRAMLYDSFRRQKKRINAMNLRIRSFLQSSSTRCFFL